MSRWVEHLNRNAYKEIVPAPTWIAKIKDYLKENQTRQSIAGNF